MWRCCRAKGSRCGRADVRGLGFTGGAARCGQGRRGSDATAAVTIEGRGGRAKGRGAAVKVRCGRAVGHGAARCGWVATVTGLVTVARRSGGGS